jgi:hypothetical protein
MFFQKSLTSWSTANDADVVLAARGEGSHRGEEHLLPDNSLCELCVDYTESIDRPCEHFLFKRIIYLKTNEGKSNLFWYFLIFGVLGFWGFGVLGLGFRV